MSKLVICLLFSACTSDATNPTDCGLPPEIPEVSGIVHTTNPASGRPAVFVDAADWDRIMAYEFAMKFWVACEQ